MAEVYNKGFTTYQIYPQYVSSGAAATFCQLYFTKNTNTHLTEKLCTTLLYKKAARKVKGNGSLGRKL